jgi:hypothetical protein
MNAVLSVAKAELRSGVEAAPFLVPAAAAFQKVTDNAPPRYDSLPDPDE